MLRSMFAAVSGLRSHQTMMDVVGNNVANVNTAGFKSSRTTFQDALNQVIRGSSAVSDDRAGTNPMQIGLGSQVTAVDQVFGQGSIQLTGRNTDLAIQGEGFFMMRIGEQTFYSRAGAFGLDANGSLTGPGGARVTGWMPDANGAIDTQQPLETLQLPTGQVIQPQESNNVTVGGNLPASAANGTAVNTSITIHDQQGTSYSLVLTFTKVGPDEWDMTQSLDGVAFGAAQDVFFDPATGEPLNAAAPGGTALAALTVDPAGTAGVWDGNGIEINFDEVGVELRQFAGATT
ncbi:MAG TPA: flagellar hook-basal body complex protein, partial [Egibacteraceae bacterium]|nr:flagellar hook-basal body complex protein [Egibacteraceae bacterium]